MARLVLFAITVVAMAATAAAAWFHEGSVPNKFIVTYSIIPDPFHTRSFFDMPRTVEEAKKEHWIHMDNRQQDNTSVWCRGEDWHVCVLYDLQGSVAGIRLSVSESDMEKSGFRLENVPEWEWNYENKMKFGYVYSATVFFQSKEELQAGGRPLGKEDLTAPKGIYILQTDTYGSETNRLFVSTQQSEALSAGFTEQACFFGMGKHYFQEMREDGQCENHRPYFTLYGPKTKTLNGFGFVQYGKTTTKDRNWFESPTAGVAKMIAPNSPACLKDWVNKYGLFTMHVYFVSEPYYTMC